MNEDAINSADALAQRFRSDYGRLCVLTALAIKQGHKRENVTEASRGHGKRAAPVYRNLRAQRARANSSIQYAKAAGVELDDLARLAREVRDAVEAEWLMRIPLFSESA